MTTSALLFYGAVAVWSAFIAYSILFSIRKPKEKPVVEAPQEMPRPEVPAMFKPPAPSEVKTRPVVSTDGFKAFQSGPELTVDDIVKGLSRT